jgi:hypothetical protein
MDPSVRSHGWVEIIVQGLPVQRTEVALLAEGRVDDSVAAIVLLGATQGAATLARVAIQTTQIALLGLVNQAVAAEWDTQNGPYRQCVVQSP